MRRSILRGFGFAAVIWGIALLAHGFSITGFIVLEGVGKAVSSAFGLILVIGGIILLSAARRLEDTLQIYDAQRGNRHALVLRGMHDIADIIQLDTNKPIDENHLNLVDLGKVLAEDVISEGDRKKLIDKYEPKLQNLAVRGYSSYFKHKKDNYENEKLSKSERSKIAREIRDARAAERVLNILDPLYKTRGEHLIALKKQIGKRLDLYNPLKRGSAAYVHFTSKAGAEQIKREGLDENSQALYFSNYKQAVDFLSAYNGNQVRKATGAKAAEQAIVFQTAELPTKFNHLVGNKSWPKVIFNRVLPENCYRFETIRVSK